MTRQRKFDTHATGANRFRFRWIYTFSRNPGPGGKKPDCLPLQGMPPLARYARQI